jgi:hypothetical protein
MNFGSMPKIRVHAPTREFGVVVRSAVSKAWDVPCSLFVAQVLLGPGTVDTFHVLSLVTGFHRVVAPALVLIGTGLTIGDENSKYRKG